jgi:hypothetical protein
MHFDCSPSWIADVSCTSVATHQRARYSVSIPSRYGLGIDPKEAVLHSCSSIWMGFCMITSLKRVKFIISDVWNDSQQNQWTRFERLGHCFFLYLYFLKGSMTILKSESLRAETFSNSTEHFDGISCRDSSHRCIGLSLLSFPTR